MEFCGEWTAVHDRMPPGPATLRISGDCCFDTGGWEARLREHDGPQGINPRILLVDLVITAPDGPVTQVQTPVPVELTLETDAEYDQVTILVVGGEGGSKTIDVEVVH